MTLKVIFDSNFLFVPIQFKIDIFQGVLNLLNRKIEPVILSATYDELKKMTDEASPKLRRQAELALKLAQNCRIVNVERGKDETSDDVILRVADRWRCPVATNDRALKQRLRDISIPVIYLRQKSRLELEGSI